VSRADLSAVKAIPLTNPGLGYYRKEETIKLGFEFILPLLQRGSGFFDSMVFADGLLGGGVYEGDYGSGFSFGGHVSLPSLFLVLAKI